ncbi:hypothetical protein Chor_001919, partial [Crotalus horridus]
MLVDFSFVHSPFPPLCCVVGLVCNRTFDMYACWGDALPNMSAQVPCPWYLPWHQQETFVDPGTISPNVHSRILRLAHLSPCGFVAAGSVQAVAGCRLAQILTQYCVCANYFWLLVEGVYLHNLLGPWALLEEGYFPVCWERNDNLGYWWIIRCPILVSILVNFVIFIRVLQILNSKLRAQQMHYTDYKSTLTLIPLLGTHEVAFALVTEEQAQGALRYVKFFFELFFNSFQ